MKKIFTRLACTAVMLAGALSANATLYLCGANVNGKANQWTPASPVTVEAVDGFYTFTAKGEFKMSTAKGDWNTFNASAKGVEAGDWKISGNTATASLKAWGSNSQSPNAWTSSEVTYKVNEALTSITASVGDVEKTEFYVTGTAFGGWGVWTDEYKMTETSENVYTYVAENGITGDWKISGKDYSPNFGPSNGQPQLGVPYTTAPNPAGNLSTVFTGKCKVTFTYNPDTNSGILLIEGESAPIDYTTWYLNVVGDFNGWEDNGVAFNADGVAKLENLAIGNSQFKIKIWNGAEMWRSNGQALNCDEWITIDGNSDQNMTIANAGEGDEFDIEYNAATNEAYVTLKSSSLTAPEKVYLMGNVNGINWTPGQQVEMVKDENANVWRVKAEIDDAGEGDGYFTFVTTDAADWDGAEGVPGINGSDRFGAPEADFPASTEQDNEVAAYRAGVSASSACSWKIPAGTYNFAFDFDNMAMTAAKADAPQPTTIEGTFNFNDPVSLDPSYPAYAESLPEPWKADQTNFMIELQDADKTPVVLTSNGVTLTQVKGASTVNSFRIYRQASGVQELRWFKNSSLKISAPANYYITKVEFYSPRTAAQSKLNAVTVGSATADEKLVAIAELPEGMQAGFEYTNSDIKVLSQSFFVNTTTSAQLIKVSTAQIVDAVEGIVADDDADAPVYYYNMQGVRVTNPENGIYIRVQGKNATKVLVR